MVNAKNGNGRTALDFAKLRNYSPMRTPAYDKIIALRSAAGARGSEGF